MKKGRKSSKIPIKSNRKSTAKMNSSILLYDHWRVLKITRLFVKPNSLIERNSVILAGRDPENTAGPVYRWRCKFKCKIISVNVKVGETICRQTDVLTYTKECDHPIVLKDLCAECGADLKSFENEPSSKRTKLSILHTIPELKVSEKLSKKVGNQDLSTLLRQRRLDLLVDLDETLVNTTGEHVDIRLQNIYHYKLGSTSHTWYHTAIRPGTHQFLRNISKLYQLHIFSFGDRDYAHRVASHSILLDSKTDLLNLKVEGINEEKVSISSPACSYSSSLARKISRSWVNDDTGTSALWSTGLLANGRSG
ncbi:hypothetical protein GJ496_004649 [Pomphorhynchus laevis]|nr:hypothetical protein GJ496_004649 [Pomphorhynchus laevis]